MTERDGSIVLEMFDAAQSSRGEPGLDDREFLDALHWFTEHGITWRAVLIAQAAAPPVPSVIVAPAPRRPRLPA